MRCKNIFFYLYAFILTNLVLVVSSTLLNLILSWGWGWVGGKSVFKATPKSDLDLDLGFANYILFIFFSLIFPFLTTHSYLYCKLASSGGIVQIVYVCKQTNKTVSSTSGLTRQSHWDDFHCLHNFLKHFLKIVLDYLNQTKSISLF